MNAIQYVTRRRRSVGRQGSAMLACIIAAGVIAFVTMAITRMAIHSSAVEKSQLGDASTIGIWVSEERERVRADAQAVTGDANLINAAVNTVSSDYLDSP